MVDLFDRDKSMISRHIKNVFDEGELQRDAVVAKFATTTFINRRLSRVFPLQAPGRSGGIGSRTTYDPIYHVFYGLVLNSCTKLVPERIALVNKTRGDTL